MRVEEDSVVSIIYTLRSKSGTILEETGRDKPFTYLHGHKNIIPGLEQTLTGMEVGESFDVEIPPEEGFGEYNPRLTRRVLRAEMPAGVEVKSGTVFELEVDHGENEPEILSEEQDRIAVYIKDVLGEQVVIDANHPLAGKILHFQGEVVDVRKASRDEVRRGHVHRRKKGSEKHEFRHGETGE